MSTEVISTATKPLRNPERDRRALLPKSRLSFSPWKPRMAIQTPSQMPAKVARVATRPPAVLRNRSRTGPCSKVSALSAPERIQP